MVLYGWKLPALNVYTSFYYFLVLLGGALIHQFSRYNKTAKENINVLFGRKSIFRNFTILQLFLLVWRNMYLYKPRIMYYRLQSCLAPIVNILDISLFYNTKR